MRNRSGLALSLVLAVTAAILATAVPASAAVFTPTRFDDPVPDACAPADCSLREAIRAANAAAGPDTIPLQAGTYTLQQVGTDEDDALDGDLDITDDLTITGMGPAATTVDGNGAVTLERVFAVDPVTGGASPAVSFSMLRITGGTDSLGLGILSENEARVTITDVTISGNTGDSFGGGIFNQDDAVMTITSSTISDNQIDSFGGGIFNQNDAVMTITSSTISGNRLTDSFGSGIMNQGDARLTITNSTISGNSAAGTFGGAIFNQDDAVLTVEGTTVIGNTSGGLGGGMFLQSDSVTTITNTTVSGNSAVTDGGGIWVQSAPTVTLGNVTITGNRADSNNDADGDGGGIRVDDAFTGTFTLRNTIVAGNADPTSDPDCRGALTSGGYNLVGIVSPDCTFSSGTADKTGTPAAPIDPKLGALADNGGPTQTHALLTGSPAIDAGNPATPGSGGSACPAADQRGLARNCDIGAYELVLCAEVPVNRIGTTGDNTLTGTDGSDGFLAGDGNDTATGLAGDDAFCMEGGNDSSDGGDGNDTSSGGAGNDKSIGGGGNDTDQAGAGNDNAKGGGGKDLLKGQGGKDRLGGGAGKDKLIGGGGKDKLNCGGGKNEVGKGGPGKDKAQKCEKGKA